MPADPTPTPAEQWWVHYRGEAAGPMPLAELLTMLAKGEIVPDVLACPLSGQEWKPLSSWPQLVPHLAGGSSKLRKQGQRTSERMRPLNRPRTSGAAALAACKLIVLGIFLGLFTGAGWVGWYWYQGWMGLPREGLYLDEDAEYLFAARPQQLRKQPLALQAFRLCLGQATGMEFGPGWDKEIEQQFGVPVEQVELLLLSRSAARKDWTIVLRLDRPWSAQLVQQTRQAGAGSGLQFVTHPVGQHLIFHESATNRDRGKNRGTCFCLIHPTVLLLAPRKDILVEAVTRNHWPRFDPPLQAVLTRTDFNRDLALAARLNAPVSQRLPETMLTTLTGRSPPLDAWKGAEAVVCDYRQAEGQFRAVMLCVNQSAAELQRQTWRGWLTEKPKDPAPGTSAPYQSYTVSSDEKLVMVHGNLLASGK